METSSINKEIQGVNTSLRSSTTGTTESTEAAATGFEGLLRNIIAPEKNSSINEEELFAALLQERIETKVSAEAAEAFETALKSNKKAMRRGDGYTPVEDAANAALEDLVEDGTLSVTDADEIKAQAFRAAQLDDNLTALYDGRGSGSDTTVATAESESALASAMSLIEQMESGTLSTTAAAATSTTTSTNASSAASGTTFSLTPEGNTIDDEGGFVFKPESEHEKKLVILLPSEYASQVEDVLLKDEDDNILERGNSSGYANGGREHFRFEKAGQDYPDNLTVEVRMTDGSIMSYEIPNPSERYD